MDTATTIFGKRYEIPIAVAPTAYQKLVSDNGEIDVARACHALGTNFILSTNATTTMEDVIEALPPSDGNYPSPWFQLYFLGDRNLTAALIRRAEAAGYEALVLTVDTAVLGNRLPMRKNPFKLPPGLRMENVKSRSAGGVNKARLLLEARTAAEAKKVAQEHSSTLVDASLCWDEVIPWLRSQTEMKIILKGIMTAEDAARAVEAGVDAIVVSNHGGRQLDGVPSTLEMLPEVADAVKGSYLFYSMAGSVRAAMCLKPWHSGRIYALSVGQHYGVSLTAGKTDWRVFSIFWNEGFLALWLSWGWTLWQQYRGLCWDGPKRTGLEYQSCRKTHSDFSLYRQSRRRYDG